MVSKEEGKIVHGIEEFRPNINNSDIYIYIYIYIYILNYSQKDKK